MAQAIKYKVEGLRELGKALQSLSDDMQKKVARAATNAGAQVIKKLAIQKAPVSPPEVTPDIPPGYLKKNIIVSTAKKKDRGRLTSMHIVTARAKGKKLLTTARSPYSIGIFQEFGTVHHAAQPFMRPAMMQGQKQAIDAIKKRLAERIDRAQRTGK